MERLTKSGAISGKDINELLDESNENQMCKTKAYYKLQEYEDLEEQGRLIKIPLEVYCIVDFKVRKGFVLEETYHMGRKPLLVVRYDDNSLKSHRGYLGISVFLTESEAEAKLNELRF